MKRMTYIAGKITDSDKDKERLNLYRFKEVELEFIKNKIDVFNPAIYEGDNDLAWEDYLARDLFFIMANRPKLYMLKEWESSPGARLEHAMARHLGLDIEYES